MNQLKIGVLALGTLVLAMYAGWRWVFLDIRTKQVDARQVEGGTLHARLTRSRRHYFGSGHWGYGGGDNRVRLSFDVGATAVEWKGRVDEEPRVLQVTEDVAYLASQESSADLLLRQKLHFYRLEESIWAEIGATSFPPRLAVCNLSETENTWHDANPAERAHLLRDYQVLMVQKRLEQHFSQAR